MTKADLIEALAAIEHRRRADWQEWVHGSLFWYEVAPGEFERFLPAGVIERWERQIATDDGDLTELEKQSDRDQVARYWPAIVEFVAAYFENFPDDYDALSAAQVWREEMAE